MSEEFTPITTQEQFDKAITDRLQRERAKYADYDQLKANAEKYKDYDVLKKKAESYDADKQKWETDLAKANTTIAEQKDKIKGYETDSVKTRIANEFGLPYEMIDRLKGSSEDEIRKDAETISKLIVNGKKITVLPLHSNDDSGKTTAREQFKTWAESINQ